MPITLPSEFKGFIERPHQDEPWIWLWEVFLDNPEPPTPATIIRLTPGPQDIAWPPGSGVTFYSYPMRHSEIQVSSEGDLPQLEITFSNVGRFLSPWLEKVDLEGNKASLFLVNRKTLASVPLAFVHWEFVCQSATQNRKNVVLRLEMPNFFERRVPGDRYNASRCRWLQFGGPECGYVINSAAAFVVCDRTLDNCVARGLDEASRNIPVIHPRRYGGFPGIPIQRS